MKFRAALILCSLVLAGCINPQFPKDAHIEKAEVKVVTPWGGYEMKIEQLDTGVAARNSTVQLRPVAK